MRLILTTTSRRQACCCISTCSPSPIPSLNMPLSTHALTVKGGCNCGTIRYSVSIPPLEERVVHPYSTATPPVRLPFVCTDHCNDCRRATGSVLPAWLCTPASMVSASIAPKSTATLPSDPAKRKDTPAEVRGGWVPASEVFTPGSESANGRDESFLQSYDSSEGSRRFWCGRCGTNLAYVAWPMPAGWPEISDIVLGTVDREDLEREEMRPERQIVSYLNVLHLCTLTFDFALFVKTLGP